MERVYTIALDTHCAFTEVGVLTPVGRMRERGRCPTTIPALAEIVGQVPRPRAVVLEEGPLAVWIKRGLNKYKISRNDERMTLFSTGNRRLQGLYGCRNINRYNDLRG